MPAGGATVGSVSVRVLPNTSNFLPSLKKYLDRVERNLVIQVEAQADTKGFKQDLSAKVKQAQSDVAAKVKTDVDSKDLRAKVSADAKAAGIGQNIVLNVGINRSSVATLGKAVSLATKGLAALAKSFVISIGVSGLSALIQGAGQAYTALIQLSGAAALLPALGAAGAASAATLVTGFSGVGDALKAMGTTGAGASKAIDAALAKISPQARDLVKTINALKPAWQSVKFATQDALFNGAAKNMAELAHTYIPVLKAGMRDVATSFNSVGKQIVGFAQDAQTVRDTGTIFAKTSDSVKILGSAVRDALTAFRDIGAVGSQFLPSIAQGAANAASSFRQFVANARETGQLARFIQGGIDALKQLLQIVVNVGSILNSVFSAANSSGTSLFSVLANITGQMAAFLKSTQGTAALKDIFGGLAAALKGILPVVSALGKGIATTIAPAIAQLGPMLGAAFNALLPAVQPFLSAVAALGPVIGSLAQLFGTVLAAAIQAVAPVITALAPVVANLANSLGPVLAGALNQLAPILSQVATIFAQAIGPVINALMPVLTQLGTLFAQVFGTILVPVLQVLSPILGQVASIISQGLLAAMNAIAPIIPTIAQAFTTLATALGGAFIGYVQLLAQYWSALAPVVASLVPLVAQLATVLLNALQPVFAALTPIIPVLVQALGTLATTLLSALMPVFTALAPILPLIATAVGQLAVAFAQGLQPIIAALAPILPILAGAIMSILNAILPLIPTIATLITAFAPLIAQIASILIPIIQALLPIVTTVFQAIVPIIQSALKIITGIINIFTGLLSGNWSKVWQGIKQVVGGVLSLIGNIIKGALNVIGQVIWSALKAVGKTFSGIFGGIVTSVGKAIGDVVSFFGGLGVRIAKSVIGWMANIAQIGINIIMGIVHGLSQAGHAVWDFLIGIAKQALDGIKHFFGINSPSRVMRDQVGFQLGMGMAIGIDQSQKNVQKSMDGLSSIVSDSAFNAQSDIGATVNGGGTLYDGITSAVQNGFNGVAVLMDGRAVAKGVNKANKIGALR